MKTTAAAIGALVRDARTAAGISQSELGKRIGVSRFWVAQFEKGKPTAEIGLALRALVALDLDIRIEPRATVEARERSLKGQPRAQRAAALPRVDLGQIIAKSTVANAGPSAARWPAASGARRTTRRS